MNYYPILIGILTLHCSLVLPAEPERKIMRSTAERADTKTAVAQQEEKKETASKYYGPVTTLQEIIKNQTLEAIIQMVLASHDTYNDTLQAIADSPYGFALTDAPTASSESLVTAELINKQSRIPQSLLAPILSKITATIDKHMGTTTILSEQSSTTAAWNRRGTLFVYKGGGKQDSTLFLFDSDTQTTTPLPLGEPVSSLVFNAQDTHLATQGATTAYLINVATQHITKLPFLSRKVNPAAKFNPDGNVLAYGTNLYVIPTHKNITLPTPNFTSESNLVTAFGPHNLYALADNSTIYIFDITNPEKPSLKNSISQKTKRLPALRFNKNGLLHYNGAYDEEYIWNPSNTSIQSVPYIYFPEFSASGNFMVGLTQIFGKTITIYSCLNKTAQEIPGYALAVHPTQDALIYAKPDNSLWFTDLSNNTQRQLSPQSDNKYIKITCNNDGSLVATLAKKPDNTGIITIFNLIRNTALQVPGNFLSSYAHFTFSADNTLLYIIDSRGWPTLTIYDIASKAILDHVGDDAHNWSYYPNTTRLSYASCNQKGTLSLWQPQSFTLEQAIFLLSAYNALFNLSGNSALSSIDQLVNSPVIATFEPETQKIIRNKLEQQRIQLLLKACKTV